MKVDSENDCARSLYEKKLDGTKDDEQWYMPHHPVINPHKLKKVCNAVSKCKEELLNTLLTGPDLLENLLGIFFLFREHQILLTTDNEAIFVQVKLPSQECRVLIFLWRIKPNDKIWASLVLYGVISHFLCLLFLSNHRPRHIYVSHVYQMPWHSTCLFGCHIPLSDM